MRLNFSRRAEGRTMNKMEMTYAQSREASTVTGFAAAHYSRTKFPQENLNIIFLFIETPCYCRISVIIITKKHIYILTGDRLLLL